MSFGHPVAGGLSLTVLRLTGMAYEERSRVVGTESYETDEPFAVRVVPAELVAWAEPEGSLGGRRADLAETGRGGRRGRAVGEGQVWCRFPVGLAVMLDADHSGPGSGKEVGKEAPTPAQDLSEPNAESNAAAEGWIELSLLTNSRASGPPARRSMPASSHSMEIGPW